MSVTDSRPRRIKRVECFRSLTLMTDAEKVEKGLVDAYGLPKASKRSLPPSHTYTLTFLELYKTEHDCEVCGGQKKSPRIAIIRDMTTNEEFYAAPDCLFIQFGEEFDKLLSDSSHTRSLFNRVADDLEVESGSDLEVIRRVSERFEELLSFPTAAADEAREIVRRLHEDPDARFSRELRGRLDLISIFLNFQAEYRAKPGFFDTRWRVIKGHPLQLQLVPYQDVIERAADPELRVSLTLDDFGTLLKALETVRGKWPKLRNPGFDPRDYDDEEDYLTVLREHYRRRADTVREVNELDPVEYWRSDFVRTMYGSVGNFPMLMGVYSEWPARTPIENFRLEGTRELARESQGRAEFYIAPEILGGTRRVKVGKTTETRRTFVRAVAFWVPDVWYPAYRVWKQFGRDDLEAEPKYL